MEARPPEPAGDYPNEPLNHSLEQMRSEEYPLPPHPMTAFSDPLESDRAADADEGARLPRSPREALQWLLGVVLFGWIVYSYFSTDNVPLSQIRLSGLLPRAPQGWSQSLSSGENPTSVTVDWLEKDLSSVSRRTYSQGETEVTVEIWDWAGDYPYHLPFDIPGWMNGDEVRVGGEAGRLRYDPEKRRGRLRVRYLDRFYVVVEGEGIERHQLDAWYRRVNLSGLRRELAQLHGKASSR